ncbi:amidase [Oryctes borbonicus]|uniref:Amidase n=1 Tax=Oryctes borbonicus TaxID=1629725 RepID=A0A0T6B8R9_9SCAR|nr:amidase [Oryctes borbonicus]
MDLVIRIYIVITRLIQCVCYFLKSMLCPQRPAKSVTPSDDPILKFSATALAEKIRKRQVYSREIIQAYIKRIKEVNPIINAVVEDRFADALEEAEQADRFLDENPDKIEDLKTNKPFFGIPITIKESIAVKGMSFTGASLSRKDVKAEKDSVVVQRLKEAGLIPLLVSTTPEYCSSIETYNKITGYTYNPYNTLYGSGGSSGGEGALLGSAASLIGVGSDICGSIRVPSIFNGIFGHKPTKRIVSLEGHWPTSDNDDFLSYLTIGPMARYAEDLKPLLKIISGPSSALLKLDEKVDLSNVQVFYMEHTGNDFCLPRVQKEIRTAIKVAAAYLSRECHCHVSNRKFQELSDSIEISSANYLNIKQFPSPLQDTDIKHNVLCETIKAFLGKSKFTIHLLLFQLTYKLGRCFNFTGKEYRKRLEELGNVLSDALGDNGVLIYPCMQTGAWKLGAYFTGIPSSAYLGIANLLGLPATAVPTGFNAKKLPVGLQVIAGQNQDRLTLAVAQELEKCFGGWQPTP